MLFVEFPNFTKRVTELLNDDEYRRLQAALIANPDERKLLAKLVEQELADG